MYFIMIQNKIHDPADEGLLERGIRGIIRLIRVPFTSKGQIMPFVTSIICHIRLALYSR
jgi:hypothetical protein